MDPRWIAVAPLPATELARSALPGAPTVLERPRTRRRRIRAIAGSRLGKEQS